MHSAKWLLKRFQATVINDITLPTLFFTLVALMVVLVSEHKVNLGISSAALTVLGTVLGLVVSFRTSSAYDRFWEGRRLWSNILLTSRNLGQIIWIHVPSDRAPKTPAPAPGSTAPAAAAPPFNAKEAHLRAVIEKKSMINLVEAYAVAVKHYLRGEAGVYYEDLYHLVSLLPRHAPIAPQHYQSHEDVLPLWHGDIARPPTLSQAKTLKHGEIAGLGRTQSAPNGTSNDGSRTVHGDHEDVEKFGNGKGEPPLFPSRSPPRHTIYDALPVLLPIKFIIALIKKSFGSKLDDGDTKRNAWGRRRKPQVIESNIPLEICLFLSSYLNFLLRGGLLQPAIATAFVNSLTSFQDCLTNLERIRTTPIPFAYQAHLRMTIWLYLIFLPFQLYPSLKWVTIPATAFAAFLFLGFLEIGQEIENPFNYDENDLDLDAFCLHIQRELSEITAHPAHDPSSFIFTPFNQPFFPADPRSAKEIVTGMEHDYFREDGVHSLRRMFLRGWRETSESTRKRS